MINDVVIWNSRLQIMADTVNILIKTFDNFFGQSGAIHGNCNKEDAVFSLFGPAFISVRFH